MNKNAKGIASITILLIAAAVIVIAGVAYYALQQTGGQQNVNIPAVTQYPPYTTPSSPSPAAGLEIQSAQDLDAANKDLNNTDVDGSMNSDLNGLSTDSSSL